MVYFIWDGLREDLKDSLVRAYMEVFSSEPWNESWGPEEVKRDIDEAMSQPDFRMFLALEDDEVVGFCWGYRVPSNNGKTAMIRELGVIPGSRSRGIGKGLLERIVEAYMDRGYDKITLETSLRAEKAIAMYQSSGFEEDRVFMSKKLSDRYERG